MLDIAPNSSGVMAMPAMLDTVAEHTAPGTLPWAIDVKAIADCTVDGSAQRNNTPSHSGSGSKCGNNASKPRPITGKSTNVVAATAACRRQCVMPRTTESRDSLAPCRKNSATMAAMPAICTASAAAPRQGSRLAARTTPASDRTKPSTGKRVRRDCMAGLGREEVFWDLDHRARDHVRLRSDARAD